ncbi:MAG: NAD(P)/FAD-dependent oxidoreductase [Acidimicrobiales bacterium]|nr:NAD(P)/FAD-dependent oxidoreductase [Acidimicrobiales bacterium]
MADTDTPLEFSPDELRERYEAERLKRLRTDGIHQYREPKGILKDFDADPFVEPGFTRDAVVTETDVVIVGAGFGGLTTAAFLRKNGIDDFYMIDYAGDVGGTWYWNRYPGCMCDVESYIYLPLLEEMGYMPKHKYAYAPEIFRYCQMVAEKYDMYPTALFQTNVTDMVWNEDTNRWLVTTDRGDQLAGRFVVICGGILHKAKLPGIPGIETYQGEAFHTARWDYSITGGGPEEPMDNLGDKVVGIIGTGATAVQAIPKLAEAAKQLFVFQRTPSAVGPRDQRETDPELFAEISSKPGWHQARIENFTAMTTGHNPDVDLVQDGWTDLFAIDTKRQPKDEAEAAELQLRDFQQMETIRKRIDDIVEDPETARALKPWYKLSCKRPCFHDDYLPAFNRDNVTLVDTDGHGVEGITEKGVVVGGTEYPLDVLVFATGFDAPSASYTHRLGFDPKGKDGVSLSEAWSKGAWTLHGIHSHGFPNMCMNSAIQGGQHINFAYTITQIAKHTAGTIAHCLQNHFATVEPDVDAEEAWYQVIMSTVGSYGAYFADCTPGYLNNEGQPPESHGMRSGAYMASANEFKGVLEDWRADGTYAGLIFTPETTS